MIKFNKNNEKTIQRDDSSLLNKKEISNGSEKNSGSSTISKWFQKWFKKKSTKEELENYFNELTQEINEINLQKQILEKNLENQNKQINEYVKLISHDINTPIKSIETLIHWFKEENEEKLKELNIDSLDLISNNIEKIDSLINGMVNYNNIDKIETSNQTIDLNLLIDEILESIRLPENFQVVIPNELPTIKGCKNRNKQLFQNLIQNAITYNDKENGIIEIGTTANQFFVKDNGPGIPEAYQSLVFHLFAKLESTNKNPGIGLALVKKIVEKEQGKIWIESKMGEGTIFFFTLPTLYG